MRHSATRCISKIRNHPLHFASIQERIAVLQPVERAKLLDDVAHLEASLAGTPATPEALAEQLNAAYRTLLTIDFARYDVHEVYAATQPAIYRLFDLSIALRERVRVWYSLQIFSRPSQKAVRDVLRAIRYAIDMLGELRSGYDRLPPGAATRRGFTGTDLNTLINPAFETGAPLPFRSGDVLLMRGRHHNSAAIARIGDINSQFSHVGIIYAGQSGRLWVVEALIEVGSTITPLEEVLDHGLARCIVFRHRDTELAARAAKLIRDQVHKTMRKRPIPYDFGMMLEPYDTLFCSKLIRQAFDLASSGATKLPSFTTRLDMKNRDFLDRIGVKAIETFAPGDMEIDPSFDLVAEWRDYRVTSGIRMQDMVMDKFFEWMEVYGYKFEDTFSTRLIGLFGRLSSYLSVEAKQTLKEVVPIIPPNMSRRTIATIAMLHQTAEPISKALEIMELERIQQTGQPLHPSEVMAYLEHKRAEAGGEIGYLVAPARGAGA